jgi:dipeptide/tripeptide permease
MSRGKDKFDMTNPLMEASLSGVVDETLIIGNQKSTDSIKQSFNISFDDNDNRNQSKSKSSMMLSMSLSYPDDPDDANDRKSVLKSIAGYIIVTEFCERLAYYGFAGSLVLFFQSQLRLSNADADIQYSAWAGFCYITPLIGGYLADTYFGRYNSIILFCSIYVVGLILVVIGTVPGYSSETASIIIFPAMYIVALGTGGIKPNVSTLGADQFDENYSQDRREKTSFFNWFYWSINLGALISYTLVAYICQYGIPALGGVKWGFFVGYMIPAVFMAVAVVIFISGSNMYVKAPPQGSILATSFNIMYEALWIKKSNKLAINSITGKKPDLLDKAKQVYGGKYNDNQVEGVKLVTRLFPFLAAMISYWAVYSQMTTSFQNQGCQMNLTLSGDTKIPVSALNMFDTIAILLFVPIFEGYVYPYCEEKGFPLTMLRKIGLGFFFAMFAMIVAALVENARISSSPVPGNYYDINARNNISPCQNIYDYDPYEYQKYYNDNSLDQPLYCNKKSDCDFFYTLSTTTYLNTTCIHCNDIPQMSSLSVFWQIPQFSLIGVSEILASKCYISILFLLLH